MNPTVIAKMGWLQVIVIFLVCLLISFNDYSQRIVNIPEKGEKVAYVVLNGHLTKDGYGQTLILERQTNSFFIKFISIEKTKNSLNEIDPKKITLLLNLEDRETLRYSSNATLIGESNNTDGSHTFKFGCNVLKEQINKLIHSKIASLTLQSLDDRNLIVQPLSNETKQQIERAARFLLNPKSERIKNAGLKNTYFP